MSFFDHWCHFPQDDLWPPGEPVLWSRLLLSKVGGGGIFCLHTWREFQSHCRGLSSSPSPRRVPGERRWQQGGLSWERFLSQNREVESKPDVCCHRASHSLYLPNNEIVFKEYRDVWWYSKEGSKRSDYRYQNISMDGARWEYTEGQGMWRCPSPTMSRKVLWEDPSKTAMQARLGFCLPTCWADLRTVSCDHFYVLR